MFSVRSRSFFFANLLILSLLISGALYAAVSDTTMKDNDKININVGIYAPFSDNSAFIGRNILAAMEMGKEQSNSSPIHYSFYTLDVVPDTREMPRVLQKFIDAHHINVLLTEGSTNGLLAAPLAKRNNLIHFSMASDPVIADGKNNFLTWSPAYEQAAVLLKELKRKHVKELGVITTSHRSSAVLTQAVMKQIQDNSAINVSVYEQFEPGTTDFTSLVSKIKGKNPDLYFIMASPEDIEAIQHKMQVVHVNKPITSIVERVTPEVIKVFDGQWYVDTHEMKPEFVHQFKEAYLNHPVTEAGYAFDVFQILNQSLLMAMKTQENFSASEIAHQLHSLATGTGVMGPFNLDKQGVLYTQSEVRLIKKGKIFTV